MLLGCQIWFKAKVHIFHVSIWILWALLRTADVKYIANKDAAKIILLSTLYLFCVYEFAKYEDKHASKKLSIFNEKYTNSTETLLFKKCDEESWKLFHKIKMGSTYFW